MAAKRKNRMAGGAPTLQIEAAQGMERRSWDFASRGCRPTNSPASSRYRTRNWPRAARVRRVADAKPGYPCRVSLTDAEPGQEVILTHFEHQPANTPYRASHAIYVRKGEKTYDAVDQVPEQLRLRLLSVRAFDDKGMMVGADVVDGKELEGAIERLLGDDRADYLHVHYAKPGCYAARIERA